jgi:hypothetical protein
MITGDESWFCFESQHTSQWSASRDEVPQRVDAAIGTAQFMLMAIWGVNGFHLLDLMPSQCRFNAQCFVKHIMAPLVQRVFPQGKTQYIPRLHVHLDNCRVHFSKVTEHFFIENQLLHVPHPSYSPDLAPSGISKLDSLAEAAPSPKNYSKAFENFWREFLLRN